MGKIEIVRIYDHEQPQDAYRILVDRVWPRGISKVRAKLDRWAKEIAPTADLRKWFNHEDEKYSEFRTKYEKELDSNPATSEFIDSVEAQLEKSDVLFLFAAKNIPHNQAVVLKEYVEKKLK
ncbi:DUF488 domain-containing protein [Pediococcus stilesii]|uniref:Marr family transcriptional regulator n=1 Tax=Pediococcus stilesii TaxID=331679 RepID=A0A0R2KWA1_9LACO|nr:DUF488 family protein [Pediococcus stilesii]KRN93758.1 marr family transcriptional regulator [Pediococcus stilesii]